MWEKDGISGSQWELEGKTGNLFEAREKASVQVVIGWKGLREYHEFLDQSNSKFRGNNYGAVRDLVSRAG